MSSHSEVANYIASISAVIGVVSAILAFLSYRKSLVHFNQNKLDVFVSKCNGNFDSCYIELNSFIDKYSVSDESQNKRLARDKIMYLLDVIRSDLMASNFVTSELNQRYDDIELKMSDITFENNFEKISRDLGEIKNKMSDIKGKLLSLSL